MIHRFSVLTFLVLVVICSCNNKADSPASGTAIVAGQIIDDSTNSQIILYNYLNEIAGDTKTYPDKDGKFQFVLRLPSTFEFTIWYGTEYATLLINPDDSIFITIDPNDAPSFEFGGTNSNFHNELYSLNDVLAQAIVADTDLQNRYRESTPTQYLEFRRGLYHENINSFMALAKEREISTDIVKYYESKFLVTYGFELIHFLSMSSMFQSFKISEDNIPPEYIATIDSVFIDCEGRYQIRDYHNLINLYSSVLCFEIQDTLLSALMKKDKVLVANIQLDYAVNNFSGFNKDYLITWQLSHLVDNSYINDDIYAEYVDAISSEYFRTYLDNKYHEYKMVLSHEPDTSKIHLTDLSVDSVSIFDEINKSHRGKALYVDIWGTWCGSCISKFAYLPDLRKSLTEADIDFLFLAIASPKEQWEKTIRNHNVEGFHYLLSEQQKLELYERISITGIPHYFVVNANGEIAIPDAKGPNDSDVVKQLKSL